jgi:hypothetical protein
VVTAARADTLRGTAEKKQQDALARKASINRQQINERRHTDSLARRRHKDADGSRDEH